MTSQETKIRFIVEQRDPETHRNFHYTVFADQIRIGSLQARFTDNHSSRLWHLQPSGMNAISQMSVLQAGDLHLPLRQLKAMIRHLVFHPQDLSELSHSEHLSFAARCHTEWKAKSRPEQNQIRSKSASESINSIPLPDDT